MRLSDSLEIPSVTYRFVARSRGKNVTFSRPGTIPDNPCVGFIRCDRCVLWIYEISGMRSGFVIWREAVLFT